MKRHYLFLSTLLILAFMGTVYSQVQDEEKIAVGTNLVTVNVSVTDSRGRYIGGLNRNNFEVFDNKAKQQIAHFSNEQSPYSIGIVYDMHGPASVRADGVLRALKQFAETLRADDDIYFLGFNERGSLAVDFVPTAVQVSTHLSSESKNSPTSLYDAIYLAVEKMRTARNAKKALLIISDGEDHSSRKSYNDLRQRFTDFDLQLYTIAIADPEFDQLAGDGRWVFEDVSRNTGRRTFLQGADAALGRAVLDEMARVTGGRSYVPEFNNELELSGVCTQISLELRRQYTIGFYPTDMYGDVKWHKIRVNVSAAQRGNGLYLSYREGYQSPKR